MSAGPRSPLRRALGSRLGRLALIPALGWLPPAASGAEKKDIQTFELLRVLEAAPNTVAAAAREGFALGGLQRGPADAAPQVGDQLTALVSLASFDGKLAPTQWIVRLRLAADPAKSGTKDATYYTNTGDSFAFHSAVSRMELSTLGPIPTQGPLAGKPPLKRQGISVSTDFLGLDLTATASLISRIKKTAAEGAKYNLGSAAKPFSADAITAARRNLTPFALTKDELRSYAGSLPALMQFLDIIRRTPGLQEILLEVIEMPSMFDVIRHGGSSDLNFSFVGGGTLDHPELLWGEMQPNDLSALVIGLEIYKKPALVIVLYLTTPAPPLRVSAGILGILAWSPEKPDKLVRVKVLSSSRGGAPAPADSPKQAPSP